MSDVKKPAAAGAAPAAPQENKMGVQPIAPLLIGMALPMMVSMLVQALYNVVDSIYVSRLSEAALTAVSLAFPVQNLMIAVGVGTGVGVNALLSRSLGEKNFERANRAANNGLFLGLCSMVVFVVFGLVGAGAFFRTQTTDAEILAGGTDYVFIVCTFSQGLFLQVIFERLLTSTGKTFYSMLVQLTGALVNIILDPILIFGLLGFPKMGVAGAAAATVAGQWIGAALGFFINRAFNHEITLSLRMLRPHGPTIRSIYAVGLPSIVMQSIGSVMTFCMNTILMGFTSTAAAVFGVYFKLQSFVFMPVFGLNNGMVPIISYNYGARKPKRVLKTMKLSIAYATGIMVVGFAIFQLLPGALLALFDASPEMLAIGEPALRRISISFLLAGFCIIAGSIFQALGNGMLSLWVSVGRQLVVLIPLAWLFSLSGDLNMVWFAFPCAELVSLVMSSAFLLRIYRKVIAPMLEPEAAGGQA